MLKYYKNEEAYKNSAPAKGIINFQQVRVDTEWLDFESKFNMKIKGSKRTFNMKCFSQDEYNVWKTKLKHAIVNSVGFQKDISME